MSFSFDLQSLKYVLLPGKLEGEQEHELYDLVYCFWQDEWLRVFSAIDPNYQLDTRDFMKQKKICVILSHGEVVGMQTLGFFTTDDFLKDAYFKPYTVGFLQNLLEIGVKNFQSMHYFLVNEKFQPRVTGQNFAAVILGLSFKNQIEDHLDATITLARKDLAAASTARKFNMHQVGSDIEMHNVPVGQLLCLNPSPYPRQDVNQLVESLWSSRIDLTTTSKKEFSYEPARSFI